MTEFLAGTPAPRTIAAARSERARAFGIVGRQVFRRLLARAAERWSRVVRAWHHHQEMMELLQLDDRMLRDVGMSRSDVLMAARDVWWTRRSRRLRSAAVARHDEAIAAADARRARPRPPLAASPPLAPRLRDLGVDAAHAGRQA